jgi:TPR repeat protein
LFVLASRLPSRARWLQRAGLLRLLIPALLPAASVKHIDVADHLGGVITGAIVGILILASWPRDLALPRRRKLAWGITAAGLFILPIGLIPGLAAIRAGVSCLVAATAQSDSDALAICDRAIAIAPEFDGTYNVRGVIRLAEGQYEGAAADFKKSTSLAPAWAYNTLLLHLARAHAGGADAGELSSNAARLDLTKWPGPLLALFLGKIPLSAIPAAALVGDQRTRDAQMCEASFYMGEYEALHGHTGHATELIRQAAKTCPANFFEYKLANAELPRLGSIGNPQKARPPSQATSPAVTPGLRAVDTAALPQSAADPSEAMTEFVSTPKHASAARSAAIEIFKRLEDCNEVAATPMVGVVYTPELGIPRFDAAGNLSSGMLKEHFLTSGCGRQRVENILTYMKGGKITVVPGIPGTTHASPVLVHDTLMYVYQAVAAKIGSCRNIRFVDTSFDGFEGGPNLRVKSQVAGGRPWQETWTVSACGSPAQVAVYYIPDETGTTIIAGLAATGATPRAAPPIRAVASESPLSIAELVDHGRSAHAEKNYSEEMRWYRLAAGRGDAAAEINVGELYANGWSVPQNYPEAMRWFRKAADQGNAAAQNKIGVLYANGGGVPRNYAEAMHWFHLAAAQGYAAAQDNIGSLYENGSGVPQDYAEAMRWLRMAADQGYAVAQNKIGVMYQRGWGVSPNYAEAMRWYQMAANQGYAPAQVNIGRLIANGWGTAKDCATGRQWFERAAAAGDEVARRNLQTGANGACSW